MFAPDNDRLNLKEIGCSNYEQDTVSFGEAWNPPQFNWLGVLVPQVAYNLAVVLAVSLGVYVLIRAIGWVIGRLCDIAYSRCLRNNPGSLAMLLATR